jgi:hypothetical protein
VEIVIFGALRSHLVTLKALDALVVRISAGLKKLPHRTRLDDQVVVPGLEGLSLGLGFAVRLDFRNRLELLAEG